MFLIAIQNYLVSESGTPSLKRFAEQNKGFIVEHSTSPDLRRFWSMSFAKALESSGTVRYTLKFIITSYA